MIRLITVTLCLLLTACEKPRKYPKDDPQFATLRHQYFKECIHDVTINFKDVSSVEIESGALVEACESAADNQAYFTLHSIYADEGFYHE